jgi:hypothetical protein
MIAYVTWNTTYTETRSPWERSADERQTFSDLELFKNTYYKFFTAVDLGEDILFFIVILIRGDLFEKLIARFTIASRISRRIFIAGGELI